MGTLIMDRFTMSSGKPCETRERNCTVNKGRDMPDTAGNKTR